MLACGLLVCCLAACRDPIPLPEAPQLADPTTLSEDPEIQQLIAKRLDVAAMRTAEAQPWTALGFAFEANGFTTQAAACYEYAAQIQQWSAEDGTPVSDPGKILYRLGAVRMTQGDLAAAAEAFAGAGALQPQLTDAHWRRGYCLLDLGDLQAAAESFETAIRQDSRGLPARLGQARVALHAGRAEEAETRLEALRRDFPGHPYVRFLLADAWRQQERHEEVAQVLQGATSEAPEWPDPWQQELQQLRVGFAAGMRRAQEALQQGQWQIALPLLEELHEERPDAIVTTTNLSAAYVGARRPEDAIALLDTVYPAHPQRFDISMNMAAAHFIGGDLDQALIWANRAHEIDPFKPRPLEMMGEIQLRNQRWSEALAAFEEATQLAPENLTNWLRLGALHGRDGRWQEAQKAYLQAVNLAPERGDLAFHLARAFYGMGRPRYAQKALHQARSLGVPAQLQSQLDQLTQQVSTAVERLDRTSH